MSFPRIKNALLCRIIISTFLIVGSIAPIVIVATLNFIPEVARAIICLGLIVVMIVYLVKNFVLIMSVDTLLAVLHCNNTARKRFILPNSFCLENCEKKVLRFGKKYDPVAISLRPETLRYKSQAPMTIFSSGIEKVIATYNVDFLDKEQYRLIINSAIVNSKALKGKKKHYFLDKEQKNSPLNRVTVIFVYAKQVEEAFAKALYNEVCKNGGDGIDTAVLPCVIDLERKICTFDSERIPYISFQYPVINRGIKIIRKYLFNNKLPFAQSKDLVAPIEGINTEQSLWRFWKNTKKELLLDDKQYKKRFEKMAHKDIIFEDDYIYLKWKDRGILVLVELNKELRIAEIEDVDSWEYPKPAKIAKETIKEIKNLINTYFAKLGYTTKYILL